MANSIQLSSVVISETLTNCPTLLQRTTKSLIGPLTKAEMNANTVSDDFSTSKSRQPAPSKLKYGLLVSYDSGLIYNGVP